MSVGRSKGARRVLKGILVVLVAVGVTSPLLIRALLVQPFTIPSGSMEPALLVGDYLFVTKWSYGYSRNSIPFAPPLFCGRIFGAEPKPGDVVIFRHKDPRQGGLDFIKRLIGLPGDRIQLKQGLLYINDKPVKRERADDFVGEDPCPFAGYSRRITHVRRWHETLPNGVNYDTLECPARPFGGTDPNNTAVYVVPPGRYFVIGDNRNNSEDSRFNEVGYVAADALIGPARMIIFSLEGNGGIRWSRLLTIIH